MDSRDDIKKNEKRPASVTALANASATVRSIETGHEYLLDDCKELVKHLMTIAIEREPAGSSNWFLMNAINIMPYAMQQGFFNKAVFPSYDEIILLRKVVIKGVIRDAIANNVAQIVYLGGGYDVRALLTGLNHPEIQIFELDCGATRDNKLYALSCIPNDIKIPKFDLSTTPTGATLVNKNIRYIESDLSKENLNDVLNKNGFNHELKTLVIAEGFTMYLDQSENEQLLKSLHNLCHKESDQLFLSYVNGSLGYTRLSHSAQSATKEMYKFYLPSDDTIQFMQKNGFSVMAKACSMEMLKDIGDNDGHQYYKKSNNLREIYYLLKNSEHVLNPISDINDVPLVDVRLSVRPPTNEDDSTCFVM